MKNSQFFYETTTKNNSSWEVLCEVKNQHVAACPHACTHACKPYFFFHTKTPASKSSSTLIVVLFFARRLALMAAIFSTDMASLKDLYRIREEEKTKSGSTRLTKCENEILSWKSTSICCNSNGATEQTEEQVIIPDLFSSDSSLLVSFKTSLQPFLRIQRKTKDFITSCRSLHINWK